MTGYLRSLAVFISASRWIGDRFRTNRVLCYSISVFALSSLACSISTGILQLKIFRVPTGIGGGSLPPVRASMLYRAFLTDQRASIQPTLGLMPIFAPASALAIGGLVATRLN
ncbi:MAG TPA: hypothetical protein VMU99_01150 [Acidimicrobiales bacterium]|nr:hypothetical protein [Acidimicrobiales bacterium]